IAARTAGVLAADPESTTTTPSSPTCTPMLEPAPAITKKEGRTARISRPFEGPPACCDCAAFRGSPCRRENAATQNATTAAIRARRNQSGNVIIIVRRTVPRRLTHNSDEQQEDPGD